MAESVKRLLKRIDDLRLAALQARAFAYRLESAEARRSILLLAADWETQADREEDQVRSFAFEAEAT
jgi:hypothetical protein